MTQLKENPKTLQIDELVNTFELRTLYRSIFEAHPWHEEMECTGCESTYARLENLYGCDCLKINDKLYAIKDGNCEVCNEDISQSLVPMWPDNVVDEEIRADQGKKGYFSQQGNLDGKVASFIWGYDLPKINESGKKFEEISERLKNIDINPEKCFYHSELGVSPDYQKKGIGTKMLKSLVEYTK
ncbi:GNAT family N-acetyltransferase, partial [Candidatus Woesearchaeota archaeon]|nr:GNAT family N-acetyltransferase [Candidatus Woesearchaeota archaeon]